jgi:hypothetical protein
MRSFTDTLDREWKISLDWDLHEQVKQREGVLLLTLGDNDCELLAKLHTDFALLVNILWILCEEQAASLGVVDDEKMPATRKFAKGLGGDVLENAAKALVGAVIDFFPNRDQRAGLANLMEKVEQTHGLLTKSMLEKIATISPEQLVKNYIDSAGSSPPSPESSPGDIRLVS